MSNSLFNFRDDEEREMFLVAIPVIAFFGLLGFWLMKGSAPEVPAPVAMAAVVDSDGDGVTDAADQCASIVGDIANYGCPAKVAWDDKDNDADGIRNGVDSCPATKGVAANNGCAAKVVAPVAPVAASIAPIAAAAPIAVASAPVKVIDTDADGVSDPADKCPNVAGDAAYDGCLPDADNDGVLGDADLCPDKMGSGMSNGCPADTDGDGFDDMSDECITVAGTANGCPVDADADGVPDAADICPSEAGLEVNNGCPADADNDGISDASDQCPDTVGVAENEGCPAAVAAPDLDNDGVLDGDDNCPSIAGVVENSGCPTDSDGDGIADEDDQCPSTVGLVELIGCPASGAVATADVVDNEAIKVALAEATIGVKFNSSSAVLTARSRELLRTVADLMRENQGALLEIRGHTDSSGNSRKNMDLSMQRARSCATFIAAQGVSVDRLKAYGYGDSQPISDNNNPVGREQNRRVEFEIRDL